MTKKRIILAAGILAVVIAAGSIGGVYAAEAVQFEQNTRALSGIEAPVHPSEARLAAGTEQAGQAQTAEPLTPAEVSSYKAEVAEVTETLAQTTLEDLETTVTFDRYLDVSDLEAIQSETDAEIDQLEVRLEKDGERLTCVTRTDKGLAETERLIKDSLGDGEQFVGFVSAEAKVDAKKLAGLQKHKDVYLADPTADPAVTEKKADKKLSARTEEKKVEHHKSFAWELEDQKVLKKQ